VLQLPAALARKPPRSSRKKVRHKRAF